MSKIVIEARKCVSESGIESWKIDDFNILYKKELPSLYLNKDLDEYICYRDTFTSFKIEIEHGMYKEYNLYLFYNKEEFQDMLRYLNYCKDHLEGCKKHIKVLKEHWCGSFTFRY